MKIVHKTSLFVIFLFLFFSFKICADDWVLAAQKFTFKQPKAKSENLTKTAEVLPQLILEQISRGGLRTLPESEILNRKLYTLQTDRISLFLQLSKEFQTRDALVLSKKNPRDLEKALLEQEKKIKELEDKIEKSLAETDKEIAASEQKIKREERRDSQKPVTEDESTGDTSESDGEIEESNGEKKNRRFPFPFHFFNKNEENKIVSENVVLYQNDTSKLFTPTEAAIEAGYDSWAFSKEVITAKINGLITGKIVTYGEYAAITVELFTYPGAKSIGAVTDVGLLTDLLPFARRLVQGLTPKIANNIPIELEFEIEPPEARANCRIMVDGVVKVIKQKEIEPMIVDAGIHTVSIEADGFERAMVTYKFSGDNRFFVHAELLPKISGSINIRLKKFQDGIFYAYGLESAPYNDENTQAKLSVNGKNVLGVFEISDVNEENKNESRAFYRITHDKAVDGANLIVNAKPFDRAKNIDKRRRRMYGAYSALICSLPFTFYCTGRFTAANNGFSFGRTDYEEADRWQKRSYAALGVTAVFGTWTIFELVRYLHAANQVLPAEAKIDKNPEEAFIQEEKSAESVEAAENVENVTDENQIPGATESMENQNREKQTSETLNNVGPQS